MAGLAALLCRPRTSLALLKYTPDQPRDDHGRWSSAGDETGSSAPQPGEKFTVFRLAGANATSLDNTNAGNAHAVAQHILRAQDIGAPQSKGGTGDTVHAYEVTVHEPFGAYSRFNAGQAGNASTTPGRDVQRGNQVTYSFPKGSGFSARLIGSTPLASLPNMDEIGTNAGAQVLREHVTNKQAAITNAGAQLAHALVEHDRARDRTSLLVQGEARLRTKKSHGLGLLLKFNADEARDDHGRWSAGGGESDQERSSREDAENYDRVQRDIASATDRQIERAANRATRIAIAQQPKAWAGDADAQRIMRAMFGEAESLKFTLRMREEERQRAGSNLRQALVDHDRAARQTSLLVQGEARLRTKKLLKFNPDEARDDHGRWTSGGSPDYASHFADNLGIVRGDMPQIPNGAMKDKFLAEQAAQGFTYTRETVAASSLKATQSTFNAENIDYLRGVAAGKYTGNPILVSSDNRVLDGHHRWVGAKIEGQPIDIIRINRPALELVAAAREFSQRNAIPARKFWGRLGLLKQYNPEQPRDWHGRWGDGNAGVKSQADVVHRAEGVLHPSAFLSKSIMGQVAAVIASHPPGDRRKLSPEELATATAQLAASVAGANADKPAYDVKLQQIAELVGGQAVTAPVKGGERLYQKHIDENNSNVEKMRDLVRGTIVVSTPAEAETALTAIRNNFDLSRAPKDRFANPDKTGYRDMLVNVKLPSGVQGEIQIHIPEMLAAKEVGHSIYEIQRTLPTDSPEHPALDRLQQKIYGAAWKYHQRRTSRGGG